MIAGISIILLLVVFAVYSAIMILFGSGWNKIPYTEASEGYVPVTCITLIIPARNEEQHIASLLRDIIKQDYPREKLEVIVVDDFSTDGTAAVVQEFIDSWRDHESPDETPDDDKQENESPENAHQVLDIRLISPDGSPEKSSKKRAISAAIEQAKGSLIITTDADCSMGPGWLSAFAFHYENSALTGYPVPRMIVGPVAYAAGNSFFDNFQALEFLSLVGSGAGAIGAGLPVMCNGAGLAYEKEAFRKVGGYEGNMGQASGDDVFLMHKITAQYGNDAVSFLKDRNALVTTVPSASPGEFYRQRVRWGSKASSYRNGFSLFTAIIVFLTNAGIIAGVLAGISGMILAAIFGGGSTASISSEMAYFSWQSSNILGVSLMLLMLKMLVDLPVMLNITRFTGQQERMVWYPLFQPLYTAYVTVTGIAGVFKKQQWKGRDISS